MLLSILMNSTKICKKIARVNLCHIKDKYEIFMSEGEVLLLLKYIKMSSSNKSCIQYLY